MKKIVFFLLCLALLPAHSQTLTAIRDSVRNGYDFWLYTPPQGDAATNDSLQISKPLIIFLHGQSLCGRNLNKVRQYGCLQALEMGRDIDAYILAPQNPGGAWKPVKIMNVFNWVQEHAAIDTTRIYVVGMSLGGFGTIDFVGVYPEKVAAAMALCGGGTLTSYCGLTVVPLWIIHGTADRAVSVAQSQRVVDAMIQCGDTSLLRFDKFKGVNHTRPARIFYLPELYEWLFAHSLTDSVRHVNKDVAIEVATLNNAYKNLEKNVGKITVINPNRSVPATSRYENDPNAACHTIRQGDTLGAIARQYRTTVSRLCEINNIQPTTILKIGRVIKVQ